ncbi:hypothetical protein ACIA8O_16760 [Kitasatospora sp. NPDC051853]|uniref:hypothetical protein n=1 Tax=Kitasatospora sp. NPDC051853 TaxID=3364058 RepID=UPI00379AFE9A
MSNELGRMRESSAAWQELRYEPAVGDDGSGYDRNAVRRARVLWALQYDRGPGDVELVRWLAGQEAQCRRGVPSQGLGDETTLAGLLLAEYRVVEDVWLHWEIKRANFDTWCGYDVQALCAAGVEATLAHVRAGEHPERDALVERLLGEDGKPWLSEQEVARWFGAMRSRFPADPAGEDPLTLVERARMTGDHGLARELLDAWAAGQERDEDTLGELRSWLADFGAFAEAAQARRESLVFAVGARDRASAWLDLAELERLAGHHPAGWEALTECRRALAEVDGWREVGLGRMYVAELFLLAGAAEPALAAEVFTEADRQAAEVAGLSLVALRAAVAAAAHVGDRTGEEHYRALAAHERRSIDGLLAPED